MIQRCEPFYPVRDTRSEQNLEERNRLCYTVIAGHSTYRCEIGRHFRILPGALT
jgi:hypothetical protein